MNWVRELCDLYEKNQTLAGKVEWGRFGEPLILLPLFHTTVTAQITVTINHEGVFLRAERVADEDKITIIPVTEKSAARTAGIEAHPLCDNLKYLSGDYNDYTVSEKGKDYSEHHRCYIEGLEAWAKSEFSHEKVRAVYKYLEKGNLMKDLIACGVLLTGEDGCVLPKEKIQNVAQQDAFVRFCVEEEWAEGRNLLREREDRVPSECWLDLTLQEAYIAYCRASVTQVGLSYLTGEWTSISYLHPKKIRNEGDGAKLISANDETDYTFRGRFINKEEAFAIGYEDSQKAHNALKWIIRRQGRNWNGLCVVTWESDLKELPDWCLDTDMVCDNYEAWEGWGDEEEDRRYAGTDPREAARFQRAIAGYEKMMDAGSQTILMAFDAATTGRLAMMECQQLSTSAYLKNLKRWHEDCGWLYPKYKDKSYYRYYGVAGVRDIANLLYGTESRGDMALKGSAEKMSGEVCKRLLPCILSGRPVPQDMVNLAVQRASSPVSYESRMNWDRTLSLACSLVKKKEIERKKEEVWTVALNTESHDRDYLYGRLLAVADRIEYRTQEKEESRETNAKRFMNAFSQQPFRTWKVIEERIQPYKMKLAAPERRHYEHMIEEICWLFQEGDFEKGDSLNGRYLLGFHNQAYALRNRTEEEKDHE